MSLKAFHVVFIAASTLCLAGFGVWGFMDCARTGDVVNGALAAASSAAALALLVYARWFLRKLRHVSYL